MIMTNEKIKQLEMIHFDVVQLTKLPTRIVKTTICNINK